MAEQAQKLERQDAALRETRDLCADDDQIRVVALDLLSDYDDFEERWRGPCHGPRLDGEAERGTAMSAIAFLLICFSATDHEVVASYFIHSETACDNARVRHASGGRMHGKSIRRFFAGCATRSRRLHKIGIID